MEKRSSILSAIIFLVIVIYVLSPLDLLPGCPVDDIAAIALGLHSRHGSGS